MSFSSDLLNQTEASKLGKGGGISSNPSLGYLFATWGRQCYDELGKLALANGAFFVIATLALLPSYLLARNSNEGDAFFPMGVLLLASAFVGGWLILDVWFALNAYLEAVFTFQYPTWREALVEVKNCAVTSFLTLTFLGGGVGILAFNLWTYPAMLSDHPLLRFAAIGLTLWVALFLALIQVHLVPFLVHQNRPFFTALRRAAMVAVWKPIRTLTILLLQILFGLLFFIPPLFLIAPSFYAALSNLSLLILLEDWKDPYEKTPEATRAGA